MSFKAGTVAIVGRPNVGKSTLLNQLTGMHVSIVTPKVQTTRRKMIGIVTTDVAQMVFLDTPGFHEAPKLMNEKMLDVVKETSQSADVVMAMVDATDKQTIETLSWCEAAVSLVVLNKIDSVNMEEKAAIEETIAKLLPSIPLFSISAKNGAGTPELVAAIIERLPESPALYPTEEVTTHSMREIAAEMVREAVMTECHEEIPYSTAVEIEAYKEKPDITVISAVIMLERDSQKAIVIGKGGAMIKRIGEMARKSIEEMIDGKVFLELHVKVDTNWSKHEGKVKRYLGL